MSKFPFVYVIGEKAGTFLELLSGAKTLGEQVIAISIGKPDKSDVYFGLGASKIIYIDKAADAIAENYSASIANVISKTPNALALLSADKSGRAMAAKLGHALKAAVINDVDYFGEDGSFGRMVYGGLAHGLETASTPTVIVTVAPGVFEIMDEKTGEGVIEEMTFIEPKSPIKLKETKRRSVSSVNIGKARKLVGIGRGFSKKEDLALASALAKCIGAELACSRPIAEGEHWLERERYIGVSGVTVKPEIYLAAGISGQIQHMVGARDSKTIIVINRDKNAPIFKFADYGIVGDLYKILPALTKALS